ncbi:MAG TPA: glycosyltransferase [Pseudomonadales bacterium]|nr:glycosyltransferase [Pseudomonadales bacterium]
MSSDSPLVSIIVPAYNYAGFVAEAIHSALQQSHRNIEVIVVDDGSTDDTAAIVRGLTEKDTRILYVHQKNRGLSAARNTGIQHSTGEFIVLLDADDTLHPQKIQAHLEHFRQMPAMDISYGRSRYFLSGKPQATFASFELDNQDWMPCVSGSASTVLPALIVNNIMPVCSAMLRRSVVTRVGDFDTTLKSLEDWDYWLRAAAGQCVFGFSEDERLAAYIRVHDTSMSQNVLRMKKVQYRLRLDNIPHCVAALPDRTLSRTLLKDNTRRRLRCLAAIARATGIWQREFWQLCRGESPVILLKMLNRLLQSHLGSKGDE